MYAKFQLSLWSKYQKPKKMTQKKRGKKQLFGFKPILFAGGAALEALRWRRCAAGTVTKQGPRAMVNNLLKFDGYNFCTSRDID